MAISHVTSETFQKDVLEHKGAVFVDFYADWCGPCKMTDPILHELEQKPEYAHITFCKIDVDKSQDLAEEYGIFSIPTFIGFRNGEPVVQFSGARDKAGFEAELTKLAQE